MKRPFLQLGLPLILVVAVLGWCLRGRENVAPQALQPVKPNEQITIPDGNLPLIKWCISAFRPVLQSAFTASNSLNQQKVWDAYQLVGTVAAATEFLTFYALLQGEWRVEKIYERDGSIKDFNAILDSFKPMLNLDAGSALDHWYQRIGFVRNEYHSGMPGRKVDYSKETGFGGEMKIRKVGVCTYHVDIRLFFESSFKGHISLCIFVFHGDSFHMSIMPFPIRPSHADPTRSDGTEIWYHTKIR